MRLIHWTIWCLYAKKSCTIYYNQHCLCYLLSLSESYGSDSPLGDSDLDSDLPVGDSDLDSDLQVGDSDLNSDSDSQVGDSDLDSDLPVGDSTTTLTKSLLLSL